MTAGKATAGDSQRRSRHQMQPDADVAASPRRPITDALRRVVNRRVPHDPRRRTFADLLAEAIVRKALEGDLKAVIEIINIVEGPRAAQPYEQPPVVSARNKRETCPTVVVMTGDPAA